MTLWLAMVVGTAIALPHAISLDRVRPAIAATIWMSALVLRALTAVFVAMFVVFFLRASELFGLVTHWCWHAVLPLVAAHLGLNGHQLGDAATVAPSFVLAASALSVGVGIWRAARAVRRVLRRAAVGTGPDDSVIVGGPEVLVAAAGIARPRVVVSAGALAALDDEELSAGLDHERGHIARRHRFILLAAELCRALARFVPGSRAAMRELAFHLERDADEWALQRRNDRLALASAICKAGGVQPAPVLVATLGGTGGSRRVRELLDADRGTLYGWRRRSATAFAVCMAALTFALVAMIPVTAAAGVTQLAADRSVHHCET